ncbi:sensor histidine kinase [Microbacterium hibisci]|uniref:sensor histidine kinase n=1 Tax=Microbacterium hibisci TaxID=2036000 RepID=UPI001943B6EF|nr:histidine kinase [Microbacterium hibisci]
MDLAVAILVQVVNWPLAALVAWRAAFRRVPAVVGAAVVVLLAAAAIAAWDPLAAGPFSRVAVAFVQMSVVVLLALYPDGRPVPRWILIPATAEIAIQLGNLIAGLRWEEQAWWPAHYLVTWGLLLFGGQLYRFLSRSSVDGRERVQWPLLGLLVMVISFVLWSIAAVAGVAAFDATWFANLLLAIPAPAFAVGLLAPRMARVDQLLRLVLHGGLWAVSVAIVAWAAAVATVAMPPVPRAWTTAVVTAIAAVPAAYGARRLADLVVYGRRADALRTLDELGGRLEASADPREVPAEIVATVTDAWGLAGAALRGDPLLAATAGELGTVADEIAAFPIRYQGDLLATLEVAPRRGDRQLTAQDRAVIEQICRQAAPALHGARVMGELIDARTRVVHAREEERKRLRRDLHDELAPTFAGLGLSAAAVQTLTRAGDERATDAAATLVEGLRSATRQLRDVAYDLRPPVLDDRGLIAAIEERVATEEGSPSVRLEAPPSRVELPAAVELAALRIVQEAVMNVRRHAAATRCVVRIELDATHLAVSVADDGRGFPAHLREGLGMRSMRERTEELGGSLQILDADEGGTIVAVRLPRRSVPSVGAPTPGEGSVAVP